MRTRFSLQKGAACARSSRSISSANGPCSSRCDPLVQKIEPNCPSKGVLELPWFNSRSPWFNLVCTWICSWIPWIYPWISWIYSGATWIYSRVAWFNFSRRWPDELGFPAQKGVFLNQGARPSSLLGRPWLFRALVTRLFPRAKGALRGQFPQREGISRRKTGESILFACVAYEFTGNLSQSRSDLNQVRHRQ